MNEVGMDRSYLINRFVHISEATRTDIELRVLDTVKNSDTKEMLDQRIADAIAKEEDRQIRNGVRDTLERNMEFNKEKDLKRKGFRLIQGGKQDEPEVVKGDAA